MKLVARWPLLILLALSLAGATLLVYSTPHGGLNVDVDSTEYYAAAHSLNAGADLRLFSGAPFTFWPPLYPATLLIAGKISGLFGLPPVEGGRWLHVLVFAGIILVSGLLMGRITRSRGLALLGAAAILCALPIFQAAVTVWSEPLFMLLSLIAFLLLQRYAERPAWRTLTGTVIFTALACLQRYMGVTVAATGIFSILVLTRAPRSRRLRDALLYAALSLAPLGLWLAHNASLTGLPTGTRPPSTIDLTASLSLASDTLAHWLTPWPSGLPPLILLVVLVACVGVIVMTLRGQQTSRVAAVPAAFVIIYLVALLAFHALIDLNPIGNRDLVPIYPPLITLLWALLDQAIRRVNRPRVHHAVVTLVALWLVTYALPQTWREAQGFRDWCCQLDSWEQIDVVRQASSTNLRGLVLSNSTLLLYTAPFDGARFVSLNGDLAQFDALAEKGDLVVWFDPRVKKLCSPKWDYCHHTTYTLDDLRPRLTAVAELSDGGLYRVLR